MKWASRKPSTLMLFTATTTKNPHQIITRIPAMNPPQNCLHKTTPIASPCRANRWCTTRSTLILRWSRWSQMSESSSTCKLRALLILTTSIQNYELSQGSRVETPTKFLKFSHLRIKLRKTSLLWRLSTYRSAGLRSCAASLDPA